MAQITIKIARALIGLATLVAVAPTTAHSAFALASRSSVFQVFHDKDGRAYVMGNNNLTEVKIYIDRMGGVRDLGNGTVMLPFNNGAR